MTDLVYFHEPGTIPQLGVSAGIRDSSQLPESLDGVVPSGLAPGQYHVTVLSTDLLVKIGPFDFEVTDVVGGVACGR
jgi:hypothetical protein